MFASYWPGQTVTGFADPSTRCRNMLCPEACKKVEWKNSYIFRDVAKDVATMKKSDGADILVYGSATLSKALFHHDLIDELRLMIYPFAIGGGLRLFDDNRELKKFGLKHSRATDDGVLILEYQKVFG
jgi:dihydrofolate reductase